MRRHHHLHDIHYLLLEIVPRFRNFFISCSLIAIFTQRTNHRIVNYADTLSKSNCCSCHDSNKEQKNTNVIEEQKASIFLKMSNIDFYFYDLLQQNIIKDLEENKRVQKIQNTFHAPQHPKNETTTIMQLVTMISNEVPPYKPMVKSLPFALAMSSTS